MVARPLSIAAVIMAGFWRGQACDNDEHSSESFRQPHWSVTVDVCVCVSGLLSSLIKRLNRALQEDMKEPESWLDTKRQCKRREEGGK